MNGAVQKVLFRPAVTAFSSSRGQGASKRRRSPRFHLSGSTPRPPHPTIAEPLRHRPTPRTGTPRLTRRTLRTSSSRAGRHVVLGEPDFGDEERCTWHAVSLPDGGRVVTAPGDGEAVRASVAAPGAPQRTPAGNRARLCGPAARGGEKVAARCFDRTLRARTARKGYRAHERDMGGRAGAIASTGAGHVAARAERVPPFSDHQRRRREPEVRQVASARGGHGP
jgi:hypothetical protein